MWEKFKGLIFIGGQSSMNVSYKLYLKSKDSKSVHAVGFIRCFCPTPTIKMAFLHAEETQALHIFTQHCNCTNIT